MVRELLMNIENVRDYQNSQDLESFGAGQEVLLTAKAPQRKLHHAAQQSRRVLDLNEEAEKPSLGRPIHQGHQRAHPAVKAQ